MNRRGFTLIEVLIALGILVTVAAILMRSMQLTYETKARVGAINDRYHEGRQVMQRVAREIRMAFLRADIPEELREEDPTFHTQFKGEDDELYFATTAHLRLQANARESDQAEVHYFLKSGGVSDSPYRGKVLYRRESHRIDDKPDRGGATWPMVEGVKELKLEYWDDKKEIADDAWKRSWDTDGEDPGLLPSRVRITLVLDMGEDRPELRFVTQAAPRIRAPIQGGTVGDTLRHLRRGQPPGAVGGGEGDPAGAPPAENPK